MLGYTFKRVLTLIPTLLAASVLVFLFVHLIPGNPAAILLGDTATPEETQDAAEERRRMMIAYMKRYGIAMRMAGVTGPSAADAPKETNEVSYVNLTCRGINLSRISPGANTRFVQLLQQDLRASPFFVATNTRVSGEFKTNETTFNVGVTLNLRRSIKFAY